MIKSLPVKRGGHNPLQFLGCKIFLLIFRTYRFISCKWVGGNDTVRNGFTDNGL